MESKAKEVIETTKNKMQKAIDFLENELVSIRAGKANPAMLANIEVHYYDRKVPINQVASITSPDARTINIQPWEKSMIPVIEKAILVANIGFNPQNNGEAIRINVPPLTEERRKELVKKTRVEGENARVAVRNLRRDAIESIKKLQKDGLSIDLAKDFETEMQKITEDVNKKIDKVLEKKEKEIMTV
ncbi:MAG: ribosome recycling factor [Prevotellaceae bacterium]|jgi:ribosome recycling factor|nr:ribosome recycling factor [Prevotellaceae bacterium]